MITLNRFWVPVGRSSLIIARCDMKDIPCALNDLSAQESPEDYKLALGEYALKSTAKAEQVLVNFEKSRGMSNVLVSTLVTCSRLQIAMNFWGICTLLDTCSVWN